MKIIFRVKGFEVIPETDSEEDYLRTVLDRIEFIYKPTYTTWRHGIKIVGRKDED